MQYIRFGWQERRSGHSFVAFTDGRPSQRIRARNRRRPVQLSLAVSGTPASPNAATRLSGPLFAGLGDAVPLDGAGFSTCPVKNVALSGVMNFLRQSNLEYYQQFRHAGEKQRACEVYQHACPRFGGALCCFGPP